MKRYSSFKLIQMLAISTGFSLPLVGHTQAIPYDNKVAHLPTDIFTHPTTPQPTTATSCVGLSSDRDRLACYDAVFKPATTSVAEDSAPDTTSADNTTQKPTLSQKVLGAFQAPSFNGNTSLLDQRWELSTDSKLGTWQLRPYQPIYVLPAFWTSDKNEKPNSPNPNNTVTESQDLKSMESKFQISFKTKAIENIFGHNGDLWLGYTQSSRWQVYSSDTSRPFRETNYEPEAHLMFRTNYNLLGLHGRLLGIGINHQSNGRSNPLSRSWNRIIVNIGFERDNFALILRPWYHLKEGTSRGDNADITDYLGHGDLTAFYRWQQHQFSLMLRNNLKKDNKGAVQFDWTFPLYKNLRGHFQLFDGYGESLIDYNHRATYAGLGLSLVNWF